MYGSASFERFALNCGIQQLGSALSPSCFDSNIKKVFAVPLGRYCYCLRCVKYQRGEGRVGADHMPVNLKKSKLKITVQFESSPLNLYEDFLLSRAYGLIIALQHCSLLSCILMSDDLDWVHVARCNL